MFTSDRNRKRFPMFRRSYASVLSKAAVVPLALASSWVLGCSSAPDAGIANADCGTDSCTASVADGGVATETGLATSPSVRPEASAPETATCTPKPGPDDPDDDFEDTNCDGIDGDKTKAIFVAPTGSDSAAGSFDAPVATITKGISLAAAAKKDVYICNDTYAESVSITTGVRLFGAFDCKAGWSRTGDKTSIAPSSGKALVIRGVTDAVKIDRMSFTSPDATTPGESSIAAFVVNSPSVTLSHVDFHAGAGADGRPGDVVKVNASASQASDGAGFPLVYCDPNNLPYNPVWCQKSGNSTQQMFLTAGDCGSVGGAGGRGGNIAYGITSLPGAPGGMRYGTRSGPAVDTSGGPGGTLGNAGVPGQPGADGIAGSASMNGLGSVTLDGYVATNAGTNGAAGSVGQAGGGGSGGMTRYVSSSGLIVGYVVAGGGGQGGFGGCGGLAGKGSGGGGASIALLLVNSPVTINWTKIESSDGGRGGSPSAGATGQPGGAPGVGGSGTDSSGNGHDGAPGGRGGTGGPGGPGAGGPSIGIFSAGGAPTVSNETYHTSAGGLGGRGLGTDNGANGESHDHLDLFVDGGVLSPTDAGSDH